MAKVLNSWKEIAAYVGRGVRTVQRWERELQFPVRRPRARPRSAVIALSEEVDQWLARAATRPLPSAGSHNPWPATIHSNPVQVCQKAQQLHLRTELLRKQVNRTLQLVSRGNNETTSEELQPSREELETTNGELQSLHREIDNISEQLEARTRKLNNLSNRYTETLRRMPLPVLLVDDNEKIQLWNHAAQKLFGVGTTSARGIDFGQVPTQQELRNLLLRLRSAMGDSNSSILRHQALQNNRLNGNFDIQSTPLSRDDAEHEGVLVIFAPVQPAETGEQHRRDKNNKINETKSRPRTTK